MSGLGKFATALFLAVRTAPAPTTPAPALTQRIARLAAEAGGPVGVSVVAIESGERFSLAGRERFPMASVFKLPLAIECLRRVDARLLRFEQPVSVAATDLEPGRSPIAQAHPNGGVTFTVAELLEKTLIEGDNTGADLLLGLCGGPPAVTARLRELGIAEVRVDRSERQLALDHFGIDTPPSPWSLPAYERLVAQVPRDRRRRAAARFLEDPRDTATPEAMGELLVRVEERRLGLTAGSADRLLDLLTRCSTGPARLKALLPPGTPLAHRTGSCGEADGVSACTNDVGILTLPQGGHAVVAVFIKAPAGDLAIRERTIARIGRAVYDYWTGPARGSGDK